MLCLNIKTTNLILNMKTDPGKVDPNMPEPTSKGEYKAPSANLHVEAAKVEIDSRQSRQAVGLYTDKAFNQKMASLGKQKLAQGIARRMQEGRQIRNDGPHANVIAQISRGKMIPQPKQLTVASMPAPKITVIPAKVEGNIDPGVSKMQITAGQYKLDFQPAKVNISVKQYSSIRMWTSQNKYDTYA